ncbi:MAG: type II secretion system GspH family protein [Planctomycetaceae bacterium]|nr:type II secretion system GspH family protein [Planctomycetaceae bacterium]
MKKRGFTLIELLVVIAIIAMLLSILMPALSKVKKIAQRVVCGTNLKGLGNAQVVYANDYDDEYAVQGGGVDHPWERVTPGFQNLAKVWATGGPITVGASLYLLVREADVSPKSFVCPSSDQTPYDGKNSATPNPLDIVQLWDFGNEQLCLGSGYPEDHVSYAYHQPYGPTGNKSRYVADGTHSAAFALMADRSPYFDKKIQYAGATNLNDVNWQDGIGRMGLYFVTNSTVNKSDKSVKWANAFTHGREGQNVMFADGHTAYETTSDVGVKNDNIYTPRVYGNAAEDAIRCGAANQLTAPGFNLGTNTTYQPVTSDDSYLVNDGKPGFTQ